MTLRVLTLIGLAAVLIAPGVEGRVLPQKKQAAASQQVHVDQLPAAVTAAVQKAYPNGSIAVAYKTSRGTEVRYELWVRETAGSPQTTVVTATPDGQIQSRDSRKAKRSAVPPATSKKPGAQAPAVQGDPIAIDLLPKPVTKAVKDAYPKDTIIQAFKMTVDTSVVYQVVLDDVASVQPMRVFVTAEGQFQKR